MNKSWTYAIYRDGVRVVVSETNEFEDSNLFAKTPFTYQIKVINLDPLISVKQSLLKR